MADAEWEDNMPFSAGLEEDPLADEDAAQGLVLPSGSRISIKRSKNTSRNLPAGLLLAR